MAISLTPKWFKMRKEEKREAKPKIKINLKKTVKHDDLIYSFAGLVQLGLLFNIDGKLIDDEIGRILTPDLDEL